MTLIPFSFKRLKNNFKDLLFLHVYRQSDEQLANVSNTIFILSLTLLFISTNFTSALMIASFLPIPLSARNAFAALDNISVCSTLCLLASSLLIAAIKGGAFERYKPRLIWICYILIFVSCILMFSLLTMLVFNEYIFPLKA